jgi:hypothetical protein
MKHAIMLCDLITHLQGLQQRYGNVPVTYWNCGSDQEYPMEAGDIEFDTIDTSSGRAAPGEPRVRFP